MRPAALAVLALASATLAAPKDPWEGRMRQGGRPLPQGAREAVGFDLDRPVPGPGWDAAALGRVWSRLEAPRTGKPGLVFTTPSRKLGLGPGQRLAVYVRGPGRQGLAGRAEVLAVRKGVATLRVWTMGAAEPWLHDPWKGWSRGLEWQPGFRPGEVEWYASARNLSALPAARFAAILAGSPPRGTPGLDVKRALGAPASLGHTDSPVGPQEQWGYDRGPGERTYVYVERAHGTLTGWHDALVEN